MDIRFKKMFRELIIGIHTLRHPMLFELEIIFKRLEDYNITEEEFMEELQKHFIKIKHVEE